MAIGDFPPGVDVVRRIWGWFLALGIVQLILGMVLLGHLGLATEASVLFFGFLLLISGGVQTAQAALARRWSGFVLHIASGLLDVLIGVLIIARPAVGAIALTLLMAVLFLVGGAMRVVMAIMIRFPNWGWAVASGLVTLLLGVFVLSEWPGVSDWFIGLYVAINFLIGGWTWVMLALAARSLPTETP
jgi:uncharacterized membrane protein HdeD (DUF308 family)